MADEETDLTHSGNPDSRREALLRLQERLQLTMESTGLAWWDQDFSTGQVERSSNWATMLGYEPHEIDQHVIAWKDLVHPEDQEEVNRAATAHESGEASHFEVEHRLRTKDGEWRWVLNWGKITSRDEKGRPLRALGTHLDITRRKQAELDRERLVEELSRTMSELKVLKGTIPICSSCKRIRDGEDSWQHLDSFIRANSEAHLSHGLCPDCMHNLYPDFAPPREGQST